MPASAAPHLSDWAEFIAAFAVFVASHAVPSRPAVRAAMVARLSERGFLALYSGVSLLVLAWLIAAAGRAPFVPLWPFEHWQMLAPNLAMPFACLLAAFGVGAANPLSFGGNPNLPFDPDRPGIAGVARHPLLWAIALWSGAHLLPNGDLAHALLFGFFALIALAGMVMIDRRKQRRLGYEAWHALARNTSFWPFAALLDGRFRPRSFRIELKRAAIGLVAWLTLLALHAPVIGVSPLP
ncbi:putative membrane protein [Rhodopseudomonas rhenobacensis]|uniref:Putative membrane protein n=1 Tax=Rhodopseudomonas rhenobacensis TaxID=87461 RepID=A0A7W7Z6I6_9BRAD|nr:NnrU family protein [Rhodopseudomonas rhenobacensis]MBB5048778.1 putative membrane protein [Rhodopseudomonas rhenobacensis]